MAFSFFILKNENIPNKGSLCSYLIITFIFWGAAQPHGLKSRLWSYTTWACVPALQLSSCVTLGELFNLSVLQFPYL